MTMQGGIWNNNIRSDRYCGILLEMNLMIIFRYKNSENVIDFFHRHPSAPHRHHLKLWLRAKASSLQLKEIGKTYLKLHTLPHL